MTKQEAYDILNAVFIGDHTLYEIREALEIARECIQECICEEDDGK